MGVLAAACCHTAASVAAFLAGQTTPACPSLLFSSIALPPCARYTRRRGCQQAGVQAQQRCSQPLCVLWDPKGERGSMEGCSPAAQARTLLSHPPIPLRQPLTPPTSTSSAALQSLPLVSPAPTPTASPCPGRRLRVRQPHPVALHLLPLPGRHGCVAAGIVRHAPPGAQGVHGGWRPVVRSPGAPQGGTGVGEDARMQGREIAGMPVALCLLCSPWTACRKDVLGSAPAYGCAALGITTMPPVPGPPPPARYLLGGALSAGAQNLGMLVAGRLFLGERLRGSRIVWARAFG